MGLNQRIPIAVAVITLIFLISLWHGRDHLPEHPALNYFKGSSGGKKGPQKSFYEIALFQGTDKVTTHHYERMYEHRLAPLRNQNIKMLEIGLGCDMNYGPGASYYTWLEYFPNVDLYYIEYDAECAALWANKTSRATVFTGDQADVAFLNTFLDKTGGNFDIIIDDGGHTMNQQRVSLKHLWSSVKPGGIYFIEDLATSYIPSYGGGGPATFMDDLKTILDDVNEWPVQVNPISKEIVNFEFTQEVVALTKVGPNGKNDHPRV